MIQKPILTLIYTVATWGTVFAIVNSLTLLFILEITVLLSGRIPVGIIFPPIWLILFYLGVIYISIPSFFGVLALSLIVYFLKTKNILLSKKHSISIGVLVGFIAFGIGLTWYQITESSLHWLQLSIVYIWGICCYSWLSYRLNHEMEEDN